MLIIIEEDGSETLVGCMKGYLHPEICEKNHSIALGCEKCSYFEKKTLTAKDIENMDSRRDNQCLI